MQESDLALDASRFESCLSSDLWMSSLLRIASADESVYDHQTGDSLQG